MTMKTDQNRKYTDYELIFEFFKTRQYDPKNSAMVDVGAQIGLWSRAYVRLGWLVVAFEPEQSNFAELIENIDNSKGNFDARRVAISDAPEPEMKFYFHKDRRGIHSLEVNHHELSADTFQMVPVSTLDRELDNCLGEREIRLLKLDIEGAELKALHGFSLQRYKPQIVICEFGIRSSSFGTTYHDLARFGLSAGYRCIVSHKKNLENKILWLGNYENPYSSSMPDNAWGELIFVRPDVYQPFTACLEAFDTKEFVVDLSA
jgi:FkbM family methyltransferase